MIHKLFWEAITRQAHNTVGKWVEVWQFTISDGARAIVAENVPSYASLSNWHKVGNSNYYVFILAQ